MTSQTTAVLFAVVFATISPAVRAAAQSRSPETSSPAAAPIKLSVATFNLRFASASSPNSWTDRRPVMSECLRQLSPDIIGTQEGLRGQLDDLAADLPNYAWIGTGRDGGNKGEFMAIFYRRDRFVALATNHFWLSDTPDIVASSTWGNTCRRMVTVVRFHDDQSGREFYVWNTHFDHEVPVARDKSAELIRRRLATLSPELPLILTGDFNCASGTSRPYAILTTEVGLNDTWTLAKKRVNEDYNTFHGFEKPLRKGVRIDWILTRGNVDVDSIEVVTFSKGGQFPSDHFPVVTQLKLNQAGPGASASPAKSITPQPPSMRPGESE